MGIDIDTPTYSIELDKGSLVRESVDRFLDSLTENEEHSRSLEWMTRKTLSQLEEMSYEERIALLLPLEDAFLDIDKVKLELKKEDKDAREENQRGV